ncbi:MAG: hypothetical protein ACREQZ_05040 [Woeseiaceae bacterium]
MMVLGIAWFAVGALGKAPIGIAERETKTGLALHAGKKAILGYVAHYAARTAGVGSAEPGQMPCPEALDSLGGPDEGVAMACGNGTATLGRLPWKTLGIDQLRDGDGEPLWYVLSQGFRAAPINFGTPPQLPFDGASVVALIIAPGRPLNTTGLAGPPPPGCAAVNQQVATRNTVAPPGVPALVPGNFVECGNAAGVYANVGTSAWSNDRAIAITAAEWQDAIAGAIADRLQRQVAPTLNAWRNGEPVANWAVSFLPYASTFSNHTTNDLCGDNNEREGLFPAARAATTCTQWAGGNVTQLAGLLGGVNCSQVAGVGYRCTFVNLSLFTPLVARVRATAPNVGGSFRGRIAGGDINSTHGGALVAGTFSLTIDTGSGDGDLDFQLSYPLGSFLQTITVNFPNLPDAAIMADPNVAWFFDNDWGRYTYYVLARGNRLSGGSPCAGPGDPDCLTLNGLPASNGNANDKQLILTLMGRAVGNQVQPSNNRANYLESRTSATVFTAATVSSTFNDRLATCPFQQTPDAAPVLVLCN